MVLLFNKKVCKYIFYWKNAWRMEWTDTKTKLSDHEDWREMRNLRDGEGKAIITIPPIVRPVVVGVQVTTVIVTTIAEEIRITVRNVHNTIYVTTP